MILSTFLTLCFAVLVVSQSPSTTVSILVPLPPYTSLTGLVGSIVGADASATTYVIGCTSSSSNLTAAAATSMGTNSSSIEPLGSEDECAFDESQTITQGSSTYHWAVSQTELSDAGFTLDCTLTASSQAVCVTTASSSTLAAAPNATDNFQPLITETFAGSALPPYQQVVLTAGLSKLKSGGASSSGPAVSTSSGHTVVTNTATASSSKTTSKSSNGATGVEPAMAMGAVGVLAIGLAAFAL